MAEALHYVIAVGVLEGTQPSVMERGGPQVCLVVRPCVAEVL